MSLTNLTVINLNVSTRKCFGTKCKTFCPKWFRLPNQVLEKKWEKSVSFLVQSFFEEFMCIDMTWQPTMSQPSVLQRWALTVPTAFLWAEFISSMIISHNCRWHLIGSDECIRMRMLNDTCLVVIYLILLCGIFQVFSSRGVEFCM